jgi:hypothetical protein
MREKNRHGKESKWKEEKGKERERKEEEGEKGRERERKKGREGLGIYKTGIFLLDEVFEDYVICLQAANVYMTVHMYIGMQLGEGGML